MAKDSIQEYVNPKEFALDQAVEIAKAYAATDSAAASHVPKLIDSVYKKLCKLAND